MDIPTATAIFKAAGYEVMDVRNGYRVWAFYLRKDGGTFFCNVHPDTAPQNVERCVIRTDREPLTVVVK